MNGFTYENQGADTLLVYHLNEEEHVDSFAKGMLQSNEITGVLKPAFMQRDMDQFLKYDITSKIPLNEYLEGKQNKLRIVNLFASIVKALDEAEEYMLGPEKFLLDTEYIYVNITKIRAYLIYLPVDEFHRETGVKEFLLNLLLHIRYDMKEDVSYVAKIIDWLNQPKFPPLKELFRFLQQQLEEPRQLYQESLREESPLSAGRSEPERPVKGLDGKQEAIRPAAAAEGVTPRREKPAPPVLKSFVEDGTPPLPVQEEKAEKKKRGLFSKKEKRKKEAVTDILIPGMEVPGSHAPEITLHVDGDTGQYVPEAAVDPKPKKSGIFFRKKEKKDSGKAELWPGSPDPPGPPQALSPAGSQQAFDLGVQGEAQAHTPAYHQAREGATVYMGKGRTGGDDDNKTVILGGGRSEGATVLLDAQESCGEQRQTRRIAKLMRKRSGQSMAIQKDVFHIGKESSYVDFYIGDNPAVGAAHADIFYDEGNYYISDRNSVNHTYVNGNMVKAGERKQLFNGDRITLADEDFEFMVNG